MSNKNNVKELAACIKEPFGNLELAQINDHAAYIMNFHGEFPMHSHASDEFYYVIEGEIFIDFKNAPTEVLRKGECITVPAYVTHRSGSLDGATVMMVKPKDMFHRPQGME